MALIQVELDKRSYPIVVVKKDRGELKKLVRSSSSGNRVFVIADAQLWALHGRTLSKAIRQGNSSVELLTIPFSEKAKSLQTAAQIQDYLLAKRICRDDLIIACGGGVTGDLVGFVAATVLRGVRWGVVTTTLMGMVDAAIGGKTGVNHRSGKNLIGSIWQPSFVFASVEYLQTLPRREMISGLGEIVKYAGLIGGPYLTEAEGYVAQSDLYDSRALYRLVASSAALKALIVCQDEREECVRAYLNFGHTFGHAIELATGYGQFRHGEAVILGLLGALELSQRLKASGNAETRRYRALVEQGVRLLPKTKLTASDICRAMALDKKRDASGLRFVLLQRPGKPMLCANLPVGEIRAAVKDMLTVYSQIGGTDAPHTHR
jgi:3-dehydroquinate synthase